MRLPQLIYDTLLVSTQGLLSDEPAFVQNFARHYSVVPLLYLSQTSKKVPVGRSWFVPLCYVGIPGSSLILLGLSVASAVALIALSIASVEHSLPLFQVTLEHGGEHINELIQVDSFTFIEVQHLLQHGRQLVRVSLFGLSQQPIEFVDISSPASEVVDSINVVVDVSHLEGYKSHRINFAEFWRLAGELLPFP